MQKEKERERERGSPIELTGQIKICLDDFLGDFLPILNKYISLFLYLVLNSY